MDQVPILESITPGRVSYWHRGRYLAMACLILPGLVRMYPLSLYLVVSLVGGMVLVVASVWLAGGFHTSDKHPTNLPSAGKHD